MPDGTGRRRPDLAVVDKGMCIDGNLASDGDLVVRGRVVGDVSGRRVVVEHGAFVDGPVTGDEVIVAGDVRGSVRSAQIVIQATGRVLGNLNATDSIDIGGAVRGSANGTAISLREGSRLEGSPSAWRAAIAGEVHGRVFALDVTVRRTAQIFGNVTHHKIQIEPGAFIDGTRPWRPRPQMEAECRQRLAALQDPADSAPSTA